MPLPPRAWIGACSLLTAFAALSLVPAPALAAATLKIIKGGGEFQSLETHMALVSAINTRYEWSHDRAGAWSMRWVVTDATDEGIARPAPPPGQYGLVPALPVVASGIVHPAPAVGAKASFVIPATAFLSATPVNGVRTYRIRVTPLGANGAALGSASPAVTVQQLPPDDNTVFGNNARYPHAEIVSFEEKIGVVPGTQISFAGATVTVRLRNPSLSQTDPAWFSIRDRRGLMRQNAAKINVPRMAALSSQLVTVPLDAILPLVPPAQQISAWYEKYVDDCGVELRSVFDFNGPSNQTPIGDHVERPLVQEGWADYAVGNTANQICGTVTCVDICRMEKNIRSRLDGFVTGYSFLAGSYPKFGGGGYARTAADAPAKPFDPQTKVTVASVSKFVTALATIAVLHKVPTASLDSEIGGFMPSDWANADPRVKKITFRQLLNQRSGIKDYGNYRLDYAKLKSFFTAPITATGTMTTCNGYEVIDPPGAFNPADKNECYSNYNTGVLQVLLPRLAGFPEDPNQASRPGTLAAQYLSVVQEHVFSRVGRADVTCRPPAEYPAAASYALGYYRPDGTKGYDWGDYTLACGGVGWYLSAEDIGKVLMSLAAEDGKIVPAGTLRLITEGKLGVDLAVPSEIVKSGGFGGKCYDDANKRCDNVTTAVAVFGPMVGPRIPAVLFINSNIAGGPNNGGSARDVLEAAREAATIEMPRR